MEKCEVIDSGYVAGVYREAGEIVELTEREKACGIRRGRIAETETPDTSDPVYLRQVLKERGVKFGPRTSLGRLKELYYGLDD